MPTERTERAADRHEPEPRKGERQPDGSLIVRRGTEVLFRLPRIPPRIYAEPKPGK